MMETFLLFSDGAISYLYIVREGKNVEEARLPPNCHLHRLGREFTLDVASDLKSVVGGALLAWPYRHHPRKEAAS